MSNKKTLDYEETKKRLTELFGEFWANNILLHIEGKIDIKVRLERVNKEIK